MAATDELDLKAQAKKMAGEAFVEFFPVYVQMVQADGKHGDYQKLLELAGKVSGLTNTEKADPYSNLPVINIVFDGGISADPRGTPAKPLQLVEVVEATPSGDSALAEAPELSAPSQETPPDEELDLDALLDFDNLEPEQL